jgi:sugar lactone lactonase YvrE
MSRATRTLASGIHFGEGPRWRDGRLWFSDFVAHAVNSVSLDGDLRTEFVIDDQPSGLGWMPDGSMLIVSMTKRQVLRRTVAGAFSIHADLNHIATFHCNDMVVGASGEAFVGNFGFDLMHEMRVHGAERARANHQTAQLAYVATNGETRAVASDMHFPNGMVITPDEKTLIVAETMSGSLTAFNIGGGGALSDRRVWAATFPRVPDGIALDADGNIWIANPRAPECARIAPGGDVLEVIDTGQPCYACMLGGGDGRTLFMLTAPPLNAAMDPAAPPAGRLLVADVETPHAGRP